MEDQNLKKTGIIVLIYTILGAGVINFSLWLHIAMPVAFFGHNLTALVLISILTLTLLLGFISSLIGGIALVTNKQWGRKHVLFSIVVSILHILIILALMLPVMMGHGIIARRLAQRIIIVLPYMFVLVLLFRYIALSRPVKFNKWIIIGIIFVCSIPFFRSIVSQTKMILPQKSSIDDNSAISIANGKVIFSWKGDIYFVSLEGNDLKQVTDSPLIENNPQCSRDGKMFCFTRKKPNQKYAYNELFVLDGEGKNERQVFKKQEDYFSGWAENSIFE